MKNDFSLGFALAPGIGSKRFSDLLLYFKTSENAWCGNEREYKEVGIPITTYEKLDLFRKKFNLKEYTQDLTQKNISFISRTNKFYPNGLLNLKDPPIGLFIKGNVKCLLQKNLIGVVGSRKITSYGRIITSRLVTDLVNHNFTVVSGLAMGIDAISHTSCIENEGFTIAVLGNGIDECFPKENQKIYNSILEKNGLITSEYPPGTSPSKGTFPARNRIIAALSKGILITEAGEDSGALITAHVGRDLGRKIFAVPGPITSSASAGTISLLKDGAILVQRVEDILYSLQTISTSKKLKQKKIVKLEKEEEKILKILQKSSFHINDLIQMTKLNSSIMIQIITTLEMMNLVIQKENGVIEYKGEL